SIQTTGRFGKSATLAGQRLNRSKNHRVSLTKRPSWLGSPTMGLPSFVIESIRVTGVPFCPPLPLTTISSPGLRVVRLIPAASMVDGEDSSPTQCTMFPLSSVTLKLIKTCGLFHSTDVTVPFTLLV